MRLESTVGPQGTGLRKEYVAIVVAWDRCLKLRSELNALSRTRIQQWPAADAAIAFSWYILRRSLSYSRRAAQAKRSLNYFVAIQKEPPGRSRPSQRDRV